jgi:LppX/LprAFG-like lipoprotein
VHRLAIILFMVITLLAGCNGGTTQVAPTPTPADLLKQAADNIRAVSTLKMTIEHSGAAYFFQAEMGTVTFNHLEGQYVAPDTIQAKVRVTLGKLPLDIDVFAKGTDQWIRGIFSNMNWQKTEFAIGFNPQTLISQENSGLQVAMASLKDLSLVGEESLEDGTAVYHLSASAAGEDVSALVAGLLQMTGQVQVDLYIDRNKILPLKFVVVQPDTITETEKEPTTWTIEIYDFNVEATLEAPEATAEATP